jgi:thiol:disulfide interchange protein
MNCPKCEAFVPDARAAECPSCGVILGKASGAIPRRLTPMPAPPQAARGGFSVQPRLLITIVAIAIAVMWGVSRKNHEVRAAAESGWYYGSEGFERASAEQKTSGAPVLLYFYTDWCGWCKKLDADVFSSPEFKQRYGSVLKVKVNAERKGADRNLALQYGVQGFPALYVLRPGTNQRPLIPGYAEPATYMAQIDSFIR